MKRKGSGEEKCRGTRVVEKRDSRRTEGGRLEDDKRRMRKKGREERGGMGGGGRRRGACLLFHPSFLHPIWCSGTGWRQKRGLPP